MVVLPGLCRIWLETPKTGFLKARLKKYLETKADLFSKSSTDVNIYQAFEVQFFYQRSSVCKVTCNIMFWLLFLSEKVVGLA